MSNIIQNAGTLYSFNLLILLGLSHVSILITCMDRIYDSSVAQRGKVQGRRNNQTSPYAWPCNEPLVRKIASIYQNNFKYGRARRPGS